MNNKLIGIATLFTAGTVVMGGAPTLGARTLDLGTSASTLVAAGCGSDAKDGDKAAPDKAKKDGSCGKGTCSAAMKDKKAAKTKKDGSCGKGKKDASCGKDKKDAPPAEDKK